MFKLLRLSLLCLLCVTFQPVLQAEDYEAMLTPDELYEYIAELYARKFDDTLLPKVELFLQNYPNHPYADAIQQFKISALNRQHRPVETIEAIRCYLQQFPKSPQREAYLRLQASCYYSLKDYANAAVGFREMSESAKKLQDREAAMLDLAYCYQELQQTTEAMKLYQTLAASPLDEAHPARLEAHARYAFFLQNEGNLQDALKFYLGILDYPATPIRLREQILYQAASLAFRLGDSLELAERLYATLLVEAPKSDFTPTALRQLCLCKLRLKKYAEFLELAQRYRQQFPSDTPDQQLDLATADILLALDRPQEALPWLRKIIEAAATTEDVLRQARYEEFCAYAALEQDEAVLTCGDAYLEAYPNSIYKTNLLIHLADSAYRHNELLRARGYLEALLPLLAGNREATFQYGCLLAKLYERDQLWTQAAELLENLARDGAEQRPGLLMQAALNVERIPDFERAKRLLDTVRSEVADRPDLLLQASELLYQIASRANQEDVAFQVARDIVEKTSGRQRTIWLTRLGHYFQTHLQYETAINCYAQVLTMPELPADSRPRLLTTQVQLLLFVKRTEQLYALLPEFLAESPTLPAAFYEQLANYCRENQGLDFACRAWTLLLEMPDATPEQKMAANLQLSEAQLLTAPQDAENRLQELIATYERQNLVPPADAYAMLAEIHLRAKNYDLALMNVDRSLEKERPAVFTIRAATRSWWVKATFLYERQHDLESAKSMATLAGYLKDDECYSPLARQLIIQILREQHLDEQANEEEKLLHEKYPSFRPTAPSDEP